LSRGEAAIRKLTQDWALACNSKQLDDLVDLYGADSIVLRPNVPPVRGTAAIREFFFSLLDAGLGEVDLEPLRVEVFGDVAYEAGRCKMLVPFAMGQRREERGKYLLTLARQAGDWKILADCWSSDLSLGVNVDSNPPKANVPSPPNPAFKAPRKGP
jgi:ketosteroid isomerase-like protein